LWLGLFFFYPVTVYGSKPEIHKAIKCDFLLFYKCGFAEFIVSEIEIPDINIEVIGCI